MSLHPKDVGWMSGSIKVNVRHDIWTIYDNILISKRKNKDYFSVPRAM